MADIRSMKGAFHLGNITAAANTVFAGVIPPKQNAITRIVSLEFLSGSTAHTLSVLRSQGKTVTTAAAVLGATELVLSVIAPLTGEDLATNDYVVYQHTDGTWGFGKISGVAVKTITIGATLRAVSSGATVYAMHQPARALGALGVNSVDFLPKVSVITRIFTEAVEVGVAQSDGSNEPLLVHCNNVTAQSWINAVSAIYLRA